MWFNYLEFLSLLLISISFFVLFFQFVAMVFSYKNIFAFEDESEAVKMLPSRIRRQMYRYLGRDHFELRTTLTNHVMYHALDAPPSLWFQVCGGQKALKGFSSGVFEADRYESEGQQHTLIVGWINSSVDFVLYDFLFAGGEDQIQFKPVS